MEYGERKLFSIKSQSAYSHDKIGIVGENGVGKTTLLDIISGNIKPIDGSVKLHSPFSYITQQPNLEQIDSDNNEKYKWNVLYDPHSGGEKTRVKIANALEKASPILLGDEPTSNLDEKGIKQLEHTLANYWGVVLLVSHDRKLLDKVCNKIWEIKNGELTVYTGNYSDYKEQKDKEKQNQQKEYDKYFHQKKSLEAALMDRSTKANKMTKTPTRMGNSEARLHRMDVRQRAGKVSNAAKNIRSRLDSLEEKEKPRAETNYKMIASVESKKAGRIAVNVEQLSFGYDYDLILDDVSFFIERGTKVCITGDNGSGKTTLLNCIVNQKEGVRFSPSEKIGYFQQNCLNLDESKTILETVMEQSKHPMSVARTILAELGIRRDDVYKRVNVLSGGEKCKVALASLLCQQCSVLILDEPTNYLDIYVLEALEAMLKAYDGTLILVSHDRYFREKITDKELIIKDGHLSEKRKIKIEAVQNKQAEISLLEMKASELIEKMKGVSEQQQTQLEQEYNELLESINVLKLSK